MSDREPLFRPLRRIRNRRLNARKRFLDPSIHEESTVSTPPLRTNVDVQVKDEAVVYSNYPGDHDYTLNSLVEELTLMERHVRDGSYKLCDCNPEKHLPLVAGLASEGVGFAKTSEEKAFMQGLRNKARILKGQIKSGNFNAQAADDLRAWAREMRHRIEFKQFTGEIAETPELAAMQGQTSEEEDCPGCSEAIGIGWSLGIAQKMKMPDVDLLEQEVTAERMGPREAMEKMIAFAELSGDAEDLNDLREIQRMMYTPLSELE